MPPGAAPEHIDRLADQFEVALPPEFRSMYQAANGFGGVGDVGPVEWAALPLAGIPQFAATVRRWFQDSHPEAAMRFVPFLDWRCGDATGYLFGEQGECDGKLTTFFHDEYRPMVDFAEFLIPRGESISEFLGSWEYLHG